MFIFCTFFWNFYGFKEIVETFRTDFVNYLVEILRIKLFEKDRGNIVQWNLREMVKTI